jgi:Tol biopolymer transport system component
VTAEGRIKVLDFGIAKLSDSRDRDGLAGTRFATDAGVAVGTAAYMSPEQVRGEPVDSRSDLFSAGSVLYEMLTATPAFGGPTPAETMAAVLRDEPPDPVVPPTAGALVDIVRHCLEKQPNQRFQSARDLAFALRALPTSVTGGTSAPSPRTPRPWVGWRMLLPLAGVIALIGAGWLVARSSGVVVPAIGRIDQITYDSGAESFPSVSADGSWVVYAGRATGNADVYLRDLSGRSGINLTAASLADDSQPALSPDGQRIAFRSEREGGGIFVMGRMGDSPRRLTRTGFNPQWSPSGREIVFASESVEARPDSRTAEQGELWVVNVDNGGVRQLKTGDAVQPAWSPDGRRIAYWGLRNRNQRDLWTVGVDGAEPVAVTDDPAIDWSPTWSPDGQWLYFSSDRRGSMNLWRIRIDQDTGRPEGAPEPVVVPALWAAHASLSADGRRLVFSSYVRSGNLQRVAFDPVREVFVGDVETLTSGSQFFTNPRPSPDGTLLAFPSISSTGQNLFVSDADGRQLRQLTFGRARDATPHWSPDGRRIAFHSSRDGGQYRIWVVNLDGSELQPLTEGSTYGWAMGAWAPDGTRLVATEPVTYENSVIDARSVTPRQAPQRLPDWESGPFDAESWSPDGRWIAGYHSQGGLVLYSVEHKTYRRLTQTGTTAQWLADGRRVFFYDGGAMRIVDITDGSTRSITAPANVDRFATRLPGP